MDVKKIRLPNNQEVNIKDYRIPGIDTMPTSGSDNVITSGGVYQTLAEFDAVESLTTSEIDTIWNNAT